MASQNFGAFVNAAVTQVLAGTELIPVIVSSVTKKCTVADIFASGTQTVTHGGTGLTTLTANAVLIGAGTGNMQFATIGTAGRILVDQGAATNPAFVTISGAGTLSSAGVLTINKVTGITDGSDAAAGIVGEIITSRVTLASPVALTNLAAKTLTSITLTAGRWLLFGMVGASVSVSCLQLIGDINTITNALSADESHQFVEYPSNAQPQGTIPLQYVSINGSTTYYLVARVLLSGGTCNGFGRISAVRI